MTKKILQVHRTHLTGVFGMQTSILLIHMRKENSADAERRGNNL